MAFCFSLMPMSVLRWLCWVPSVECLLTFPALRVYWREALTAVLLSNLLDLSSIAASLGKPAF